MSSILEIPIPDSFKKVYPTIRRGRNVAPVSQRIRTSKTVTGTTHYYTLNGSQILTEQWGNIFIVYLYQIGGSYGAIVYGVPVVAGGNFDIIPSSNNGDTYYGITSSAGLGVPGKEFYVTGGMTGTVSGIGFNVFDFAESIFQKIMEW